MQMETFVDPAMQAHIMVQPPLGNVPFSAPASELPFATLFLFLGDLPFATIGMTNAGMNLQANSNGFSSNPDLAHAVETNLV